MFIAPFKNYDEFKQMFGIIKHGNGVESRKNRILLAFHKHPAVREIIKNGKYDFINVKSMAALKNIALELLTAHRFNATMKLNGYFWYSPDYTTDSQRGICLDGSIGFIRYVRRDNERVFKMRAGKMFRHLIDSASNADLFPEQVKVWLVEELVADWTANEKCLDYELHVDDDFKGIYSGKRCGYASFGSCMQNEGYYTFYEKCVDAKAAYLTQNDIIVARAIIYTEVTDEAGIKYRLLERQYAADGDELLKTILIQKLIAAGEIDGYKKVGAGCSDSTAFVGINGEDFSFKDFSIPCHIEDNDYISYQDSFKYYVDYEGLAYNFEPNASYEDLDITSGHLDHEYDEYHERYCRETREVFVEGRSMYCDVDDMDDFVFVDSDCEYHHKDDCVEIDGDWYLKDSEDVCYCEYCDEWELCCNCVWSEHNSDYIKIDDATECDGDWYFDDQVATCLECDDNFVVDKGYYSELTGKTYCCEACMLKAEAKYRELQVLALA